ncbi:MAG: lysophospholipid acyltransferase family protein [Bacteroidales bacterium]|nr:lysophospholipid acyltransferase family protein [Bacteroidales bacterium]
MKKILAYFLYGLISLITLPPIGLLYALSPVTAWFLRIVLKYRKQIISENLKKSFPDKSGEDLLLIEKSYYAWLGRMLIESFKAVHWSVYALKKRVNVINPEILTEYAEQNQDIIILAGHTGNWEWSPGAISPYGHDVLGIYKPQTSETFDHLSKLLRTKSGVIPIPMKGTIRALKEKKENGQKPRALLLIADQIPALGDIHFWTNFLNQQTAWFTGGEKLALRFKLPVLYLKFREVKTGHYSGEFIPLYDGKEKVRDGDISRFYIHALEQTIIENPTHWLWSHRRWKHQPESISL